MKIIRIVTSRYVAGSGGAVEYVRFLLSSAANLGYLVELWVFETIRSNTSISSDPIGLSEESGNNFQVHYCSARYCSPSWFRQAIKLVVFSLTGCFQYNRQILWIIGKKQFAWFWTLRFFIKINWDSRDISALRYAQRFKHRSDCVGLTGAAVFPCFSGKIIKQCEIISRIKCFEKADWPLLYCGDIAVRKGLDKLIALDKYFGTQGKRVICVGRILDTNLLARISKCENVEYRGEVSLQGVMSLMSRASGVIFPSDDDFIPRVVLLGLMSGHRVYVSSSLMETLGVLRQFSYPGKLFYESFQPNGLLNEFNAEAYDDGFQHQKRALSSIVSNHSSYESFREILEQL